jgi:hypothetical protein
MAGAAWFPWSQVSTLSQAATFTVEAGNHDRHHSLITLPSNLPNGSYTLTPTEGPTLSMQVDAGTARWIVPHLAAGTRQSFTVQTNLPTSPTSPTQAVQAFRSQEAVELRSQDRLMARYLAGPGEFPRPGIPETFRRGGYLHPILTPSGRPITDDYPPNHIHHHGFWTAWTRTEWDGRRPDFWNMGQGTGRVDFSSLVSVTQGPVFAGFRSRQVFTDLTTNPAQTVLEEEWMVRAYRPTADAEFFLIDVESTQTTVGDGPLRLPKYHYGGFGYRGPWGWNGPTQARYLDSNGVTDRKDGHATRVRWFWLGGTVNHGLAGLAMLGHPDNFRAPQPLRVHPTEPFVCWSPSQLGDWQIARDQPHVARYRLVPMDGEPDAALLDRLWHDFAEPPVAR